MSNETEDEKTLQFHEMGLDDRILEVRRITLAMAFVIHFFENPRKLIS